jgi:predicted DNA-binding transcriptional regulator AlpA
MNATIETKPTRTTRTAELDRMLGVEDIATILGIHKRTLNRMRAAKTFPSPTLTVAGKARWTRAVFEAWVASGGTAK